VYTDTRVCLITGNYTGVTVCVPSWKKLILYFLN